MKQSKVSRILLAVLLVLTMVFTMIPAQTTSAAKAGLNKKKITLEVGKQYKLKVTAKGKATWSSSNMSVAKVNNGTVTGMKAGKATITCKVGAKKYTCKVTVKKKNVLYPGQKIQGVNRTISTVEEMNQFISEINAGNNFAGQKILQIKNIQYAGMNTFTPAKGEFAGTFDGAGYFIDGIKLQSSEDLGVFLNNKGTIKNLYLTGMQLIETGISKKVGAIVADNDGIVDGCFAEGVITSAEATNDNVIGGIVGFSRYGKQVRNCITQMTIDCSYGSTGYIGGLVGKSDGTKILNNLSYARLSGKPMTIGGLVGVESSSAGELSGNLCMGTYGEGDNISGIAAEYRGNAKNSYFVMRDQTTDTFKSITGTQDDVSSVSEAQLATQLVLEKLNAIANSSADLKTWKLVDNYPQLEKLHQIKFNELQEKGDVECQRVSAYEGESITVNVHPYVGRKVKQIAVVTATGQPVASVQGKTSLTFTMPRDGVVVSVMYK